MLPNLYAFAVIAYIAVCVNDYLFIVDLSQPKATVIISQIYNDLTKKTRKFIDIQYLMFGGPQNAMQPETFWIFK